MKNVVVLGGSVWQSYLVDYLKSVGYVVHSVCPTNTTNADFHIPIDVKDVEGIIKAITPLSPLFVCSDQSDVTPMPLAKICHQMGLPGNHPDVIRLFTDKHKMYEYAASIGVSMPATKIVSSLEDVVDFVHQYGFPVVIKPTDSNSSKGFAVVNNITSVQSAIKDALTYSNKAIVQEYVVGEQVTLDGFCSGGRHRVFAAASIGFGFPPGSAKEGVISSVKYPFENYQVIYNLSKLTDRFVENSGLKFGITHAECRYTKDKVFLLEIAARGGGCGTSSVLVPWVTGQSFYHLLHRSLLGEEISLGELSLTEKAAWLEYFAFPPGKPRGNLERTIAAAKEVKHVADFKFSFKQEDDLPVVSTGAQRHSLAMFLGDRKEELEVALQEVKKVIRNQGW